jgi:arginyl-tRNA synthetase
LRDLIDWVGKDAVRFFLVSRRPDSEFVFDIDLALSKSEENPVYYVQYAHARICSVLAQKPAAMDLAKADLKLLGSPHELAVCAQLREFPVALDAAARDYAPHGIAVYLKELAAGFHGWYNAERLLVEDVSLQQARLALAQAVRQTLANGLKLLGVSAPESM